MYRENKLWPYFQFWQTCAPLFISYSKVVTLCLLYNFETDENFFMNLLYKYKAW